MRVPNDKHGHIELCSAAEVTGYTMMQHTIPYANARMLCDNPDAHAA